MSKLNFSIFFLSIMICFSGTAALAAEAFVIDEYHVTADVTEERVYKIREEIDVNFTQQSHGIIRSIPTKGAVEQYKIRNIHVTGVPYKIERADPVTIKIGDADQYVTGKQSYVIDYALHHIQDDAADGDYVYISLIGTQWDTVIANAELTVNLPTDKILDTAVYTGKYGAVSNTVQYEINGSQIRIHAEALKNFEGVTIKVKLPEGTFANAPGSFYPYSDAVIYGILGFIVLVLFAVLVFYLNYGKDRPVVPIVEFYPPDRLSPAEIGYVIDRQVSADDASALIFYWASLGYLTYEQGASEHAYTLHKTKEMGAERPLYEQKAFRKLWALGDGDSVTNQQLRFKYYESIADIQAAVPDMFTNEKKLDRTKSKVMSIAGGTLCALAGVFHVIAAAVYADSGIFTALILSGIVIFAGVMVYTLWYLLCNRAQKKKGGGFAGKIGLLLGTAGFCTLFPFLTDSSGVFPVVFSILVYAMVFFGIICSVYINQRTDYGQQILERTVGFQEFLETAEKERIEALIDETPGYFYDILPYALALGVTKKWADRFSGIVTEPPSWYTAHHNTVFSTMVFAGHLNGSMHAMRTDLTASPQTSGGVSGSFGGGFSGGGSGGGGGSSW